MRPPCHDKIAWDRIQGFALARVVSGCGRQYVRITAAMTITVGHLLSENGDDVYFPGRLDGGSV